MKTRQNTVRVSALIVTILGAFITPFYTSSINIALPQIGRELAMDAISLSWMASAYQLASVIFVLPLGRIADIYGRKKNYVCGIIIFTVASLFLAGANSGVLLIALRFLQGIGGAFILSSAIAILTSVFPSNERGSALGLFAASIYVGMSVGPFFGGVLTQYFGWRSIFIICVPISLVVITLIFWKLKGDWIEAKGERFDVVGSVIYSLALVAVLYGFTHLPGMFGIILILVGAIGLVAFGIWEARVASPVLDIKLFQKNRTFAFSCLAALINYGATAAVAFLLSFYLQYIKGFTPLGAGFVLLSQPVVQALFSPFAGRLSDKVQPRIVASIGMGLTFIGLLAFVFLSEATTMPLIIAGLVLLGLGFALFSSPNTSAIMGSVEKRFYGVASATVTTMRQLGMIGSMSIVMLLFALYMGNVQITAEYNGVFLQSVRIAFIISAVSCFGGIFASLTRGNVDRSHEQMS